jgi:hypothetical protein
MIETRGAPRDQGLDQATALAAEIRGSVAALRGGRGWLSWRRELETARRGCGRALSRFAPQLHERLQGIAEGCGVSLTALELGESLHRGRVVASAKGARIEGAVEAAGFELILRHSDPDAGGFPSVELTAPVFASALAGVNSEGIAVACVDDGPRGAPPARALVQDVLFRVRTFASAIDHLRRRAAYLGSSGAVLIAHASGEAARVELQAGRILLQDAPASAGMESAPSVCIDATSCALVWSGAGFEERVVAAVPASARAGVGG